MRKKRAEYHWYFVVLGVNAKGVLGFGAHPPPMCAKPEAEKLEQSLTAFRFVRMLWADMRKKTYNTIVVFWFYM
jgi:hypothetical protein